MNDLSYNYYNTGHKDFSPSARTEQQPAFEHNFPYQPASYPYQPQSQQPSYYQDQQPQQAQQAQLQRQMQQQQQMQMQMQASLQVLRFVLVW